MNPKVITIKTFRLDNKIPIKINQSRSKYYQRPKSRNLKSFNFIKNRSQTTQRQKCSTERPKTSHLLNHHDKKLSLNLNRHISLQKQKSFRFERQQKDQSCDNINKSVNFFPRRRPKKFNNPKWYKYCVNDCWTPPSPPPAQFSGQKNQEKSFLYPRRKQQPKNVTNLKIMIPKFSSIKKHIPKNLYSQKKVQYLAEISPWSDAQQELFI